MIDFIPFLDAIRTTGLTPPSRIRTGRIYRFPGLGKARSNRAGWCRLSEDGRFGSFGDWSSGLEETWAACSQSTLSPHQRKTFIETARKERAAARDEKRKLQLKAALLAKSIWTAASAAQPTFPYLLAKGISSHTGKIYRGTLVLPVTDFSRSLTSLQFISTDGSKRLLAQGRKRGCFIPIAGCFSDLMNIVICEGWATGCSLAENSPELCVIAAIDAGNLAPVALGIRRRFPNARLIIAGDDDRLTPSNPGATKAKAAAIASDALLALPEWPEAAPDHLTDFNDLALFKRVQL
ncbi:MAG: toprim domain-containing protein [Marinobacter sp.]|uniref:toprim domain-containing protein n=1 Tax=Marinobacter sp. TaxID=50741 RepID=UPI0032971693